MQKIVPHLWFDKEAKEAAEFYSTVFPDSHVDHITVLKDTPSGDCDSVYFTLMGTELMSISAGPYFKINPSISFMVNFDPSEDADARVHMDEIWGKLAEGAKVLMPLGEYPFSKHYGWLEDKYGVSWQLIFTNPEGEKRPMLMTSMLFVGDVCGKTQEATDFYIETFKNAPNASATSARGALALYPAGREPDKEGTVMFTDFQLAGQWFVAMDSAHQHNFAFNEGLSVLIRCEDQEEIDYFWQKLSADPASEQCGWCKDKYGVSWQITPRIMDEIMTTATQEQIDRVTQAFLPMKKLEIAPLLKALKD